jgi:hypothetical protein
MAPRVVNAMGHYQKRRTSLCVTPCGVLPTGSPSIRIAEELKSSTPTNNSNSNSNSHNKITNNSLPTNLASI